MSHERRIPEERKMAELDPEERLIANLFGYSVYPGYVNILPISDSARQLRNTTIRRLISEIREEKANNPKVIEYLRIVELRYGLAPGAEPKTLTLEEVGNLTNQTRKKAKELETNGLRVLRHP